MVHIARRRQLATVLWSRLPHGAVYERRRRWRALCITGDAGTMRTVRTTVDLPPGVHRRAQQLAASRGQSLSAVIAELAARGLAQLDEPVVVSTDERSGFPVISIGRRITSGDVGEVLDDE